MAILIDMDMPEECGKCCFLNAKFSLNPECSLEGRNPFNDTMNISRGRPYWCPLREVVRCKDCVHRVPQGDGLTHWYACMVMEQNDDEWFCSFGERREE